MNIHSAAFHLPNKSLKMPCTLCRSAARKCKFRKQFREPLWWLNSQNCIHLLPRRWLYKGRNRQGPKWRDLKQRAETSARLIRHSHVLLAFRSPSIELVYRATNSLHIHMYIHTYIRTVRKIRRSRTNTAICRRGTTGDKYERRIRDFGLFCDDGTMRAVYDGTYNTITLSSKQCFPIRYVTCIYEIVYFESNEGTSHRFAWSWRSQYTISKRNFQLDNREISWDVIYRQSSRTFFIFSDRASPVDRSSFDNYFIVMPVDTFQRTVKSPIGEEPTNYVVL